MITECKFRAIFTTLMKGTLDEQQKLCDSLSLDEIMELGAEALIQFPLLSETYDRKLIQFIEEKRKQIQARRGSR